MFQSTYSNLICWPSRVESLKPRFQLARYLLAFQLQPSTCRQFVGWVTSTSCSRVISYINCANGDYTIGSCNSIESSRLLLWLDEAHFWIARLDRVPCSFQVDCRSTGFPIERVGKAVCDVSLIGRLNDATVRLPLATTVEHETLTSLMSDDVIDDVTTELLRPTRNNNGKEAARD